MKSNMCDGKNKGSMIAIIVVCVAIIMSAYTALVMLLWNWLIPDLFGANEISFMQSFGLIVLTKLLFIHTWSGKARWKAKKLKNKVRGKEGYQWNDMEPGFEARMKEKFMSKCGSSRKRKQEISPDTEANTDVFGETS